MLIIFVDFLPCKGILWTGSLRSAYLLYQNLYLLTNGQCTHCFGPVPAWEDSRYWSFWQSQA
jgi:hypothetical protein